MNPKTLFENSRGTCPCCAAVLKTLEGSEGDVSWQRLSYMKVKERREHVKDGSGDIRKFLIPQPSSDLGSVSGRKLAQSHAFPDIGITKSDTWGHGLSLIGGMNIPAKYANLAKKASFPTQYCRSVRLPSLDDRAAVITVLSKKSKCYSDEVVGVTLIPTCPSEHPSCFPLSTRRRYEPFSAAALRLSERYQ